MEKDQFQLLLGVIMFRQQDFWMFYADDQWWIYKHISVKLQPALWNIQFFTYPLKYAHHHRIDLRDIILHDQIPSDTAEYIQYNQNAYNYKPPECKYAQAACNVPRSCKYNSP